MDAPFEIYTKSFFPKYEDIFNFFVEKDFKEEKINLENSAHFYFYICKPHIQEKIYTAIQVKSDECEERQIRDEIRIVGICSIIETLMTKENYKDPFEYLDSKYVKQNKIIENLENIRIEYFNIYGLTKSVKEYFSKYIRIDDQKTLLNSLKKYDIDKKIFLELNDIDQLAALFYEMRSDFVHNIGMPQFCPLYAESSYFFKDKKSYSMEMNADTFLRIFEKSFVNYWTEKFNDLNT